jgi:hypothetical protein
VENGLKKKRETCLSLSSLVLSLQNIDFKNDPFGGAKV